MKTENLRNGSCPQRDSTEYEGYAEASRIDPTENMEQERKPQAETLMNKIVEAGNMAEAMKRVRQNNGAPGVDGKTVADTIDWMKIHFAEVQAELLGGYYHPTAVRRKEIPKPDGGVRKLGIPTAEDRIVQQAIAQQLGPIYEQLFSDNSYGYRPGRSAQQAIMKVKEYADQGYEWAIVMDLSKYFDTLNHDRLIRELRRTIKDEMVMNVIKKFLKAGVMENGVVVETVQGSPQGGPLSPLLSGIYLNEFDWEYSRRGVPELRYADDILLLAKSQRAAERILKGAIEFLEGKLKLTVNRDKSKIVNLARNHGEFKFLGFGMYKSNRGFRITAHSKSMKKFKDKLKLITSRKRSGTLQSICSELKRVVIGWLRYFAIADMMKWTKELSGWLRRRVRMLIWKRWKKPRTKLRKLMHFGVPKKYAWQAANSRYGYWFTVNTSAVTKALDNKRLASWGVPDILNTYKSLHNKPVQLQFVF